jgi:hypothetical protein
MAIGAAHARQHVVDAVADGLAQRDGVPSLKGGRKVRGKKGTLAPTATTRVTAATSTRPLRGSAQARPPA